MTKKDKKALSLIANKLPTMQHKDQTEKVTISGFALIAQGQTEFQGKKIEGGQRFITTRPKRINHKTELEKVFKKYGMDGVHSYVKGIHDAVTK